MEDAPLQGRIYLERLGHMQCGFADCRGWWAIGDPPLERSHWYCPWCGRYQAIATVEGGGHGSDAIE